MSLLPPAATRAITPATARVLAIVGIALSAISAFGAHRIMRLLMTAFPEGNKGAASPEALALGKALLPELSIWLGLGLFALIPISLALWKKRNREMWFFACGLILSLAWTPSFFPYGLYLAIVFLLKWKDFMNARRSRATSTAS